MKKEYNNKDITVIWQPDLCIHSAKCFHSLPEVFKPRERPWVQMEGADSKRIEDAVRACPSGALSLKTAAPIANISIHPTGPDAMKVTVIINGPTRLSGPCQILMPDGSTLDKPNGVSICRCGLSATKPFCDGSHKTNGFTG